MILAAVALLTVACGLPHTHALHYTASGKTTYTYSPLAAFGSIPRPNGNVYVLAQAAPFDMCTPVAESLKPLVRGLALLVQRGGCSFVRKACIAQQAGASAVVVYNNFKTDSTSSGEATQPTNDIQQSAVNYPVHMFGISNDVRIPVVMVSSREGIQLNQLVMHGGGKVTVNITTEAPPQACGAWDRWSDDPLQCNSKRQRNIRIPLQAWMRSRNEAMYNVVEDVQIARLAFTIGAVLSCCYLIMASTRKTRMDQVAQTMQKEHARRVLTLIVMFLSFFLLAFSYGIDEWGGDCEDDHVATVFMLQRLASSSCIVAYLLEAYYIHSNEDGHTNPYLNDVSKQLPTSCGRAFIKLEIASIYIIDFIISYLYVTKDRSYISFVTLSSVRLCLHFVVVVVAHFGAVQSIYKSVMVTQHLGSDTVDATKPIVLPRDLNNRFQFLLVAKLGVLALMLQGIFISVQIIQQGSILFNPNSLDYPSVWLDSYFTFLALPQLFQLWVSCVVFVLCGRAETLDLDRVAVEMVPSLCLADLVVVFCYFFYTLVRFNWVSAVVCIFFFRIVL